MQLFSQGKDTGFGHINYIIETETTRNGTYLGLRYKITWRIDNKYYFGFNIKAQVFAEGQDRADVKRLVKSNSPNRGSGVAYYPSENDYYWFNKGYGSNQVTGCRVILHTTNGSNQIYDTGADKTLSAPVGYVMSTLGSTPNFNIGDNLAVLINDVTNQGYNYKLYLDVVNESNNWQNVISNMSLTSKNFTWDLQGIKTNLYNMFPNTINIKTRLVLETYINSTYLGTNIQEGTCYITNSNPNVPDFVLFSMGGFHETLEDEITSIVAGYGSYKDWSNVLLATKDSSIVANNGATLKKIIIEWNGAKEEIILGGV